MNSATGNRQPASGSRHPASGNRHPADGNRQTKGGSPQKRQFVQLMTDVALAGTVARTSAALVVLATILVNASHGSASVQSRTLESGAYTAAQQKRGAAIYNRECSTCHGEMLKGGEGSPPISGPTFAASFGDQTVADLFEKIRGTMPAPPEQPGKLTAQETADVVAHILSVNRFPAGDVELPPDVELLKRLRIPRIP